MRRRTVIAALLTGFAAPPLAHADSVPLPPSLGALGELALTTGDGAQTTLSESLMPGPSVISFWATWCAPCLLEGRHLARVRARYAPEALNIIGVNIDQRRNEARIAAFMARGNMGEYTQLRGGHDTYLAFERGARAIALPRCFVFAADGRATAAFGRYNGAATLRQIDSAIAGVMPG